MSDKGRKYESAALFSADHEFVKSVRDAKGFKTMAESLQFIIAEYKAGSGKE